MSYQEIDFYNKTNLNSYNLNESMRYQLNMLDNLDVFTRKHSENVANLTCRICEYLKLNKNFIVYCTMCAYLHDIGKQFIPSTILQKPAKLTDKEYEVIKRHTTIGYDICIKDLNLRPFANGPKYHHEALDGSGYPEGITKKDIPIEGQIIRVADEYDAIVSKRQYKTHVGISDTLKILVENTKPYNHANALNNLANNVKLGKDNPIIVKCLFKVVLDDIDYEISCIMDYIDFLKEQIKRLDQIDKYYNKMINSKKEKEKNYYLEGIKILLTENETVENYKQILEEYKAALIIRKNVIDNLFNEIKIIKKLMV